MWFVFGRNLFVRAGTSEIARAWELKLNLGPNRAPVRPVAPLPKRPRVFALSHALAMLTHVSHAEASPITAVILTAHCSTSARFGTAQKQ